MSCTKLLYVVLLGVFTIACGADAVTIVEDDQSNMPPVINVKDLSLIISDDLANDTVLGTVEANITIGTIRYEITSQTPVNAITIDESTGALMVMDEKLINATSSPQINIMVSVTGEDVSEMAKVTIRVTPGDKLPKTVMYVEVNDQNILNTGAYTLSNGKPFFDYAVIFAANINYDEENNRPILFLNTNVAAVLENRQQSIATLQEKGIKVLLSILGNRQRYGFANLPDRETASDFAAQVADVVNTYNLDGIDLDDEFVNYGQDGVPPSNEFSFVFLVEELRKVMPDKLITLYNIGPSANNTSFNGVDAGSLLSYSWQPFYGIYNGSVPTGLVKEKYSASAINITSNSVAVAVNNARRTKEDGFGAFMMYNLTATNYTSYLNGISEELYDQNTTLTEALKEK